jgi:hypothetical protein
VPLVASRNDRNTPPPYPSSQYSDSTSGSPPSSNWATAKRVNANRPSALPSITTRSGSASSTTADARKLGS